MSWLLPSPLLLVAGVLAVVLLTHLLRRPVSDLLVMVATSIITLVVLAMLLLAWEALGWFVQRW